MATSNGGYEITIEAYTVCLNVSFDSPLAVDFIRSSFSESYSLTTYWPKDWSIVEVYYQPQDNKSSFVIVKLASKSGGGRPLILKKIRKHIQSPATIVAGNKRIGLKKSLSAYCLFELDTILQNIEFIPWWLKRMKDTAELGENGFNISQYVFDRVNINNDIFGFGLKSSITKLSLCDQVELYEDDADFIDALNPYLLRLNANGKLLFEDQFLATRDQDTYQHVFRICLEDSPFNKIKTSFACQFKQCFSAEYLLFQLLLQLVILEQI